MCVHNFVLHNGCGHKTPFPGSREYTLCGAARSRLPNASPLRTPAGPPPLPPKDKPSPPPAAAGRTSSTSPLRIPEFFSFGRSASDAGARNRNSVQAGAAGATGSPQKRASVLEKRGSKLQRIGSTVVRRHGRTQSAAVGPVEKKDSGEEKMAVAVRSGATVPQPLMSPFEEYVRVAPGDLVAALCGGEDLKVFERREESVDVCERCKTVINEMRWLVKAYDDKHNIKGCRAYWYVDVARPDEEESKGKEVARR